MSTDKQIIALRYRALAGAERTIVDLCKLRNLVEGKAPHSNYQHARFAIESISEAAAFIELIEAARKGSAK